MTKKPDCLVIGGTRFFGKRLVANLLDQGSKVWVLSRTGDAGGVPDHPNLVRLRGDRSSETDLFRVLGSKSWDVVYDQVAYAPDDALDLLKMLRGRVGRLVFTSSQSVYDPGAAIRETAFDPLTTALRTGKREDFSYVEGKRLTEAAYAQQNDVPVTMVRIPIVLGPDDYTKRLLFHIEHVATGKPMWFPSIDAKISFISSDDAGKFLARLSTNSIRGPINACSPTPIPLRKVVSMIEGIVGRKADLASAETESNHSPFGIEGDWWMDVTRAASAGFRCRELDQWLENLIREGTSQIAGARSSR